MDFVRYGILVFALSCLDASASIADCGGTQASIPSHLIVVSEGRIKAGTSQDLVVFASRDLAISAHSENLSIFTLMASHPSSIARLYCSFGKTVDQSSSLFMISNAPMGRELLLRMGNVGRSGGPDINFKVLADIDPEWGLSPEVLVRRRLHVFVFADEALLPKAETHIENAVLIWRRVGIDFKPIYHRISQDDFNNVLGSDRKLESFFGESDRYIGEWEDRYRLQALKPAPNSLAVAFADLRGPTKADVYLNQVYIDLEYLKTDVFFAPPGRTVAHEIGHLLLGGGHTGNPSVQWTSGLMRAGNQSTSDHISEADAKIARATASGLPD